MSDNLYLKPPLPVQVGPYVSTLHIHRDERGVAWIDDSNIKVVEVILDFVQGWSPDKIHEEHSHLSLAQIYAAIAYYQDYKQEIESLMQEWRESYEREYAKPENQAWRKEILARSFQRKKALSAL